MSEYKLPDGLRGSYSGSMSPQPSAATAASPEPSKHKTPEPRVYADAAGHVWVGEAYPGNTVQKLEGSNLSDMFLDGEPEPGKKFDADKPRYELVPWDALDEVTKALTLGAAKYADDNWRQVKPLRRYLGAAFRHLSQWAQGERYDSETGLSHLAHAGASILFLLAREEETHGGEKETVQDVPE